MSPCICIYKLKLSQYTYKLKVSLFVFMSSMALLEGASVHDQKGDI